MAKQANDMGMTIDGLAAYVELSASTLCKLCADGKVPGRKVGRHGRLHKVLVNPWLCGKKEPC